MPAGTANMNDPLPQTHCGACCTSLRNVGVRRGGRTVLAGINLHLHCGELTALIGPNGAGKTTLLRTMLGDLPRTGEILFIPFRADRRQPRIGYVPQRLDTDLISPVTVLDLFCGAMSRWPLWLGHRRGWRAEAARGLARVNAAPLLERRIGELSGGQLQRVLLALALTPLPDVLLLDEPAAGVDRSGLERFFETISELRRKHDLSVLLVSHDLPGVAAVADRMLFLQNGALLREGAPREVLADPRVKTTLGFDRDLRELPVGGGRHYAHGPDDGEEARG